MKENEASDSPKRTILYYPTITVPNGRWLRQALLYWDEIGSIVPETSHGSPAIPYTPDIEYLKNEGEFRPFNPDLLFTTDWDPFFEELDSTVRSSSFQRLLPPGNERRLTSRIHKAKVTEMAFGSLRDQGLATEDERNRPWYLFEEKTALLYMSILAKHLADVDIQATVPGTDRREYEKLVYDAPSHREGFACLDVRFGNALPVPRDNVPLSTIVEFKRNNRVELLRFRQLITDFQHQLSEANGRSDAKDISANFADRLRLGLHDLGAALNDARVSTVSSSGKVILNIQSPALWEALGIIAVGAATVATGSIMWTIGGLAISALIEVGHSFIEKRNERRAQLRGSAFAYLYHAQSAGVV